ncbi:MAG: aspartyl protease [bacterium]
MGIVFIKAKVSGPAGEARECEFLVDSGAVYSQLPQEIWQPLGLVPQSQMDFTLTDGTQITRSISECSFEYSGIARHSPVVLGEAGDPALLGMVTLETMGLVLNPFNRTLQPMKMMLA